MLLPSKKRKRMETAPGASIAPARGIRAFGKITKPGCNQQELGKSKLNGKSLAKSDTSSSIEVLGNHKKRKLQDSKERLLDRALHSNSNVPSTCQSDRHLISEPSLRSSLLPLALSPVQKATPKRNCELRSNPVKTPTQRACSCIESFTFPSSPISESNSSLISKSSQTVPSSPVSVKDFPPKTVHDRIQNLPDELQDLIHLHSSFLNALSLYYAHHGSLTPADLRLLKPGIERSWKKRKVSGDDVRRILSIAQSSEAADPPEKIKYGGILSLSDYGRGKICVEIEEHSRHQGIQRSPLDEENLKTVFAANLDVQWKRYITTNFTSPSAQEFISLLPLLPVTPCASISKVSPLLSKGQRRLEDLKAGAIKTRRSPQLRSTPQISALSVAPNNRIDSLLSRICAKQIHQSTLPSPPSIGTILRKSALHRLQEIAPVIELLITSASISFPSRISGAICSTSPTMERGTISVTMPTLVQHLQMSLKNPIAKEDAVRCVRLLAEEVAPGWVKVREVGRVVCVTVRKEESVGREDLAKRVDDLLARL
ncbi:hypothetical protein MMC29_007447 [Sticta canariensis]|nr:hypothetical protein [Sticta canariensis]